MVKQVKLSLLGLGLDRGPIVRQAKLSWSGLGLDRGPYPSLVPSLIFRTDKRHVDEDKMS